MIIYDAEITGSFKIDGTTISSIGSLDTLSGSIVTNSSSIASLEAASGSYANSASFATDISSNSSSIASLNAASASYLLNTTDTFTGDLTVTGEVIAQTLHVQQVTSSIVYSSGSNVFGETVADTQKFTGSLQVSGSDSHILGNLGIGTTSNFSGAELDVYGNIALAQQNWAIRGNAGNTELAIEELSGSAFNDSNVRLTVKSGGNVGIGVSPSQLVHARKDQSTETRIRVENQSTSADAYSTIQLSTYGNTWGIRNGSTAANSNSLEFVLDSGGNNFNLFNINSSGNVGIGATPAAWNSNSKALQLPQYVSLSHQHNASLNLMSFALETGANSFTYADTGVYPLRYNQDPNNGSHSWYTASTGTAGGAITWSESMRIDSSGRIGIGVVPSSTTGTNSLDVSGAIIARGLISDHQTSAGVLDLNGDMFSIRAYGATAGSGYLVFKTGGGGGSTDTERMRIDSSGNVSLSTGDLFINSGTSYNDKGYIYLSNQRTAIISDIVNLTANGDTSLDFQTRSGGSTASAMFIDEFRKVGIGTTSPDRKLEVRSDTSGDVILARFTNRSGNTNDGAYIGFSTGYDAEATIGAKREGAENDSSLVFSPMLNESPVEKMRLTSTGILQLNTDVAPSLSSNFFISRGDQYGFHIHTQTGFTRLVASDDNLYLGTGTDTSTVTIKNATVGIGDTNPDNKLHVNSGTTNIAAKFESTDATGGIMLADSTGNVELTTSSTNGFNVQPGGGDVRFRIDGNGKIASRNSHDGQSYRREYTWSNGSVSNGTVVDLIENGSAYTDITFIAFIEVFHSGRTYRVIKGSFGGYGYNVTSSGNGIAALTQQVTGTGTAKLQFDNNSGYNASVHIHIIIYGDSSITVHNGYLSSL